MRKSNRNGEQGQRANKLLPLPIPAAVTRRWRSFSAGIRVSRRNGNLIPHPGFRYKEDSESASTWLLRGIRNKAALSMERPALSIFFSPWIREEEEEEGGGRRIYGDKNALFEEEQIEIFHASTAWNLTLRARIVCIRKKVLRSTRNFLSYPMKTFFLDYITNIL